MQQDPPPSAAGLEAFEQFAAARAARGARPDLPRGVVLGLAEHAAAVYGRWDSYQQRAVDAGFEGAFTVERGTAQLGVAYSPRVVVVAARGSDQFGDWGENLLAFRAGWPRLLPAGARVHVGFQLQARRLLGPLLEILAGLTRRGAGRCRGADLWFAGHSLGGALVPLLLLGAQRFGPLLPAGGATFNAPRLGNAAFARHFAEQLGPREPLRVVAFSRGVQDLVSRVPLSAWGYVHVGRPLLVSEAGSREGDSAWQDYRAARPVRALEQWRIVSRLSAAVQAHSAQGAVDLINQWAEASARKE